MDPCTRTIEVVIHSAAAMLRHIRKKNKSILDYLFTVGSRGANRLITLLISVMIARLLGVEDFGLYSLFFGIFILLFQTQSGMNIAYVRYTKTYDDSDKSILRLSLNFQFAVMTILVIAGWPFAYLLNNLLDINNINTIYLGIVSSGLLGFFGILFGIHQSKGQFVYLGLLTVLYNFLIFLAIALAYVLDITLSLDRVLYLYFSLALIMCVASMPYLWKRSEPARDKSLTGEFYRMILINVLITLLYFLYRYIDVYFIKYYSDLQSVGIYSAAMKTSMLLNILTGALPTILLPKAVTAIGNGSGLRTYLKKSFILVMAISAVFFIFMLFAPAILVLLFGVEYASAGHALQILIIGWILNTAYIPVVQLLYALNRSGWRLLIESIKLVVAAASFMLLIPTYGGVGAAYGLLIAITVALLLASITTYRLVNTHLQNNS